MLPVGLRQAGKFGEHRCFRGFITGKRFCLAAFHARARDLQTVTLLPIRNPLRDEASSFHVEVEIEIFDPNLVSWSRSRRWHHPVPKELASSWCVWILLGFFVDFWVLDLDRSLLRLFLVLCGCSRSCSRCRLDYSPSPRFQLFFLGLLFLCLRSLTGVHRFGLARLVSIRNLGARITDILNLVRGVCTQGRLEYWVHPLEISSVIHY